MQNQHSTDFISALQQRDRGALARIPKSDLHNHALLGSRRSKLEAWSGKGIPAPPSKMKTISEMDAYLFGNLAPALMSHEGFAFGLGAAFQQAKEDGVNVLEMSIDSSFVRAFPNGANDLVALIKEIKNTVAPELMFIPQLGINRGGQPDWLMEDLLQGFETGYFRSIDLYGDELAQPPEIFKEIYQAAAAAGLHLKAHVGEFGDAASVRHTVEVLELEQVQHGIAAASSPEVMRWLSSNNIQLNVCPTSNVMLCRAESIASHPIRTLFDYGVKVTVNTDDLMIFDQSVSDEFYNLFDCGLFSAEELDEIRLEGLNVVV